MFDFIHAWRMPTFFLLAGFFAHLVLVRRPKSTFVIDRLKRIALPLVLFGAVMVVIIPPIWIYGWYGSISIEAFQDVLGERPDLDSSGELVAHLWFLYYLLLMYAALIGFRLLGRLRRAPASVGAAGRPSLGRYIGNAVYTRLPLLMTLAAVILLVVPGRRPVKADLAAEWAGRALRFAVLLLWLRVVRSARAHRSAHGNWKFGRLVGNRDLGVLRQHSPGSRDRRTRRAEAQMMRLSELCG